MSNRYIIQTQRGIVSNLFLKDAPPTGFTSTKNPLRATRFNSLEEVAAYRKERGVFNAYVLRFEKVAGRAIFTTVVTP